MEKKKTKQDLMKESQELADAHAAKKLVIETALNDLDEKAKKKVGEEHIKGMGVIETLMNELDEIAVKQMEVNNKIRQA